MRARDLCSRCYNRRTHDGTLPATWALPLRRSYRPTLAGTAAPDAPTYAGMWGYQRPAPATNARPLGGQFRHCYTSGRVGVLSDEIGSIALGNPTGSCAPWHAAQLRERAAWGLEEADAA